MSDFSKRTAKLPDGRHPDVRVRCQHRRLSYVLAAGAALVMVASCSSSPSSDAASSPTTTPTSQDSSSPSASAGQPSTSPAGASSPSAGSNLQKLTISEGILSENYVGLYAAVKQGFFKDQGLDVDLKVLGSGSELGTVLASGSVQVAAGGPIEQIPASAKGLQVISFAFWSDATVEFCVTKSWADKHNLTTSSSVSDILGSFKGAKVGVSGPASTPALYGQYIFPKYGASAQNISLGSSPAIVTALQSGQVDGALASPPTCEQASVGGKVVTLLTPSQIPELSGVPQGSLIATKQYAQDHPDILKKVAAGVQKGNQWAYDNPQDAVTLLASYFPKVPVDLLTSSFNNVIRPEIPTDAKATEEGWSRAIDIVRPVIGNATVSAKEGDMWTNEYVP